MPLDLQGWNEKAEWQHSWYQDSFEEKPRDRDLQWKRMEQGRLAILTPVLEPSFEGSQTLLVLSRTEKGWQPELAAVRWWADLPPHQAWLYLEDFKIYGLLEGEWPMGEFSYRGKVLASQRPYQAKGGFRLDGAKSVAQFAPEFESILAEVQTKFEVMLD